MMDDRARHHPTKWLHHPTWWDDSRPAGHHPTWWDDGGDNPPHHPTLIQQTVLFYVLMKMMTMDDVVPGCPKFELPRSLSAAKFERREVHTTSIYATNICSTNVYTTNI